jgi:hypothetical protein
MTTEQLVLIKKLVAQNRPLLEILNTIMGNFPGIDENAVVQSIIDTSQSMGRTVDVNDFDPSSTAETQTEQAGTIAEYLASQPPQETMDQAFSRFLSVQPFAQSPTLRSAAGNLRDLAQRQFMLQQPQNQGDQSSFRNFLNTGSFLQGQPLQSRLANLAGDLFAGPGATGNAELQSIFATQPGMAFEAFGLPQLQSVAPFFRPFAEASLREAQNRFFQNNPGATSADVAKLFGFNTLSEFNQTPPANQFDQFTPANQFNQPPPANQPAWGGINA